MDNDHLTIKAAFISVNNKEPIVDLAKMLDVKGIKIYASSGTALFLTNNGIKASNIDQFTGFSSLLGGRIKTLHPAIYGSVLYDKVLDKDNLLGAMPIDPVQLVIVSLYPFEVTSKKMDATMDDLIENIDVGGVSLIRASAKNFKNSIPVVDEIDYPFIMKKIEEGKGFTMAERQQLASKAFRKTSIYDSMISEKLGNDEDILLTLKKEIKLRYGENPHQKGNFYSVTGSNAFKEIEQLHGAELSYNNLIDMDSAVFLINDFDEPFAVVVKHVNPCGAAVDSDIVNALSNALSGDATSAYGSVIAINRKFSSDALSVIKNIFVDCLIAPDFDDNALEKLKHRKKIKIIKYNRSNDDKILPVYRGLRWGILIQDHDDRILKKSELKVVTRIKPSDNDIDDMLFGWKIIKQVRSNGILLIKNKKVVGVGAGQMSRVMSVKIACMKAGEKSKDSVLISDAFFPFKDGIEVAAEYGVKSIIEPGGSIRDAEVIETADKYGMGMMFTGWRRFTH